MISKLKSHALFSQLNTLAWQDFLAVLIQRRFLSLSIVNVYELAIDALTDKAAKQTIREILHEEYPRNTKGVPLPSHRELLFQDLLNLGATPEMILTTPETTVTREVREQSYQVMVDCWGQTAAQIQLIAWLRFWAEVLVAVEYSCLWQRISERLASKNSENKPRSEFYYFHLIHDSRNCDIGQENLLGGLTHPQELAIHLARLVDSSEALDLCITLEKKACLLKYKFYNQFLDSDSLKHL
ncbi:MAG: hypothetical protein AAGE84_27640 [Cyanobacteria bacterium P01_G01_bin.39]